MARGERADAGSSSDIVVQWDPERALGGDGGRHACTHPTPAQRSLQMFKRPELCLYSDGRRPGIDRCDKRGAKTRGWGLLHGALSHDAGSGLPSFGDARRARARARGETRARPRDARAARA